MPSYTEEEMRAKIDAFPHWYHKIEVAPGIATPGVNETKLSLRILDELGLPKDMSGLRVLDIGCRDGFYCFEAERRGATEVIGIDFASLEYSGFPVIKDIFASQATYHIENVYNLNPETYGQFDVVFFLGLLYHLRNPMLALDKIRTVVKPGSLMFVKTHVIDEVMHMPDGSTQSLREVAPNLMDVPILQFFPKDSFNKDATNQFSPNIAGLRAIITEAEFTIRAEHLLKRQVMMGAEAVDDSEFIGNFAQRDYSTDVSSWGRPIKDD